MQKLTDKELIEELKRRFNDNKKALLDLKQLTKQLEVVNKKLGQSEALKSNFLSNIRNEINNPLTSILGLSENLMSDSSPDYKKIISIAKMIHSEAFTLDFQLSNIFIAADLEAGEAMPGISKVDINYLILNLIAAFRYRLNEKQLTVNYVNKMSDQQFFKTDAEKLRLVLSNLLCNAIEFSREAGQIEVKAWFDEGSLRISVKDAGIGINKSEQKKIFDRFVQLDTGINKHHKGHGLGLAVTKELLNLMNGIISVSTNKTEGCLFTITIPETESMAEADIFALDGNELIFDAVVEQEF